MNSDTGSTKQVSDITTNEITFQELQNALYGGIITSLEEFRDLSLFYLSLPPFQG